MKILALVLLSMSTSFAFAASNPSAPAGSIEWKDSTSGKLVIYTTEDFHGHSDGDSYSYDNEDAVGTAAEIRDRHACFRGDVYEVMDHIVGHGVNRDGNEECGLMKVGSVNEIDFQDCTQDGSDVSYNVALNRCPS